jgi:hypothetical protein
MRPFTVIVPCTHRPYSTSTHVVQILAFGFDKWRDISKKEYEVRLDGFLALHPCWVPLKEPSVPFNELDYAVRPVFTTRTPPGGAPHFRTFAHAITLLSPSSPRIFAHASSM